jgi:Flp pilus assembly pilin Flp
LAGACRIIKISLRPPDRSVFACVLGILPLFGGAVQKEREPVARFLQQLWNDERGQDIAEYAVMLAVILVIVVGTIRLIGSNANNVFSNVGSSLQ